MADHQEVVKRELSKPFLLAAAISCTVALCILAYGYLFSFERLGLSGWAIAASLVVLVVISVGSLAKTKVIPWGSRNPREWFSFEVLGTVVFELFLAALSATAIIQLFDPKDAPVEVAAAAKSSKRAADAAERVLTRLGTTEPGLAFQNGASGVWGERGCAVTYRVEVMDEALIMRSLRNQSGMAPFKQTLRLAPAEAGLNGEISRSAEILDGPEAGASVGLMYSKHGDVERFERSQKRPQRSTTFERCAG